jgi:hypothetical protein
VITWRDPTPEERTRQAGSYRRFAVFWIVFGIANLALGSVSLADRRFDMYPYALLVVGAAYLGLAWRSWVRSQRELRLRSREAR